MEKNTALNQELKESINKIFADLFKEIGNNRQQLSNTVLSAQMGINKELSRDTVDAKREKEMRNEVSAIVRLAAKQLPHLKMQAPKPAAPKPAATPKPPAPAKPASAPKTSAATRAKKKK